MLNFQVQIRGLWAGGKLFFFNPEMLSKTVFMFIVARNMPDAHRYGARVEWHPFDNGSGGTLGWHVYAGKKHVGYRIRGPLEKIPEYGAF